MTETDFSGPGEPLTRARKGTTRADSCAPQRHLEPSRDSWRVRLVGQDVVAEEQVEDELSVADLRAFR